MELKEALQSTGYAQGKVKCTFTELYDAKGNFVFSLQSKHTNGALVIATDGQTIGANNRIAVRITDAGREVLQSITKDGSALSDSVLYVTPSKMEWESTGEPVTPIVPVPEISISKKKLLLIGAALLLLLKK